MRQKIVAGNWKMNKTRDEALALTSEIVNMVRDEVRGDVQVVVCVPFVYLTSVGKLLETQSNISLGAQNCHQKASGAFTGEISAAMLQSVGTQYVILGHSERRQYFGESNELLKDKVNIVLENGMKPIFCCGETLEQREQGIHFDLVCNQLTESLFHLTPEQFANVVIAYEPIWAIGTGKTATSDQAQEMHAKLRAHIASKYGAAVADATSILYGGSANPGNARELFGQSDVDGGLIGGASLKSRDFLDIIKSF
ncbi:triose-phosphate isomerase [Xanthocytophaga flava]|uniref:triose-phosphate isomerase n=1 Tax=Xanthocytophaga flava TaxID=3048013 RepID=UPI0028D4D51C|nr:triose-phosphate isomerase [Xanthocytophaga flavus]MDJ1468062.1 triose-phosphate isomerase [Xanthocytophaga flavus]